VVRGNCQKLPLDIFSKLGYNKCRTKDQRKDKDVDHNFDPNRIQFSDNLIRSLWNEALYWLQHGANHSEARRKREMLEDYRNYCWQEFTERYPGAYYFLLGKAHENEKRILAHELEQPYTKPERKRWIESRLADLSWLI